MKKILTTICGLLLLVSTGFGQGAKKPTIMVLPSEPWCFKNKYMIEYNDQGIAKKTPDYKRAFQENTDLLSAIAKINTLMQDRGFPLKVAETMLRQLEDDGATMSVTLAKDGSEVTETPLDKLKSKAKADIIIYLTWDIAEQGPKKQMTLTMAGVDSYSAKQIAGGDGRPGAWSFASSVPDMIHEIIGGDIDNFNARLMAHFTDMADNGREITIRVRKFGNWSGDMDTEIDGKPLQVHVEDWLNKYTVKSSFSNGDGEATNMLFDQVRIPLYDASGRAIDAKAYTRGLKKLLDDAPFNIPSKLVSKGLGEATLILGSK